MRRGVLVCAAALSLAGCNQQPDPEAELIADAKAAAARNLKDPDSAKFRGLVSYPDKDLVCGEINGKNSYGAYSGFVDFYYQNGFAAIADEGSIFRPQLDKLCLGALREQGEAALARAKETWKTLPDSEEKRKALAEIEALER